MWRQKQKETIATPEQTSQWLIFFSLMSSSLSSFFFLECLRAEVHLIVRDQRRGSQLSSLKRAWHNRAGALGPARLERSIDSPLSPDHSRFGPSFFFATGAFYVIMNTHFPLCFTTCVSLRAEKHGVLLWGGGMRASLCFQGVSSLLLREETM